MVRGPGATLSIRSQYQYRALCISTPEQGNWCPCQQSVQFGAWPLQSNLTHGFLPLEFPLGSGTVPCCGPRPFHMGQPQAGEGKPHNVSGIHSGHYLWCWVFVCSLSLAGEPVLASQWLPWLAGCWAILSCRETERSCLFASQN